MKKRLLSLFLLLCTLVSSLSLLASPASAAETEAEPEGAGRSTASYVDLYVKDGLVALFDAHSATASNTALSTWAPVNLYGKAGYETYIDPSLYTVSFRASTRYEWRSADGAIYSTVKDSSVASSWSNYTLINLDTLGALIGTTYTVQEVFTQRRVENAVAGGVFTNYAAVTGSGHRASANWIGPYNYGGTFTSGVESKTDGVNKLVGVLVEQMQFGEVSNAYIGHFSWIAAEFGTVLGTGITAPDGTDLSEYYIGASVIPVERTISRLGVEAVEGGWRSTFGIHYQRTPWCRPGTGRVTSSGYYSRMTANESEHKSASLQLAGDTAYYHSIRIYNRELNNSECEQNHFADLAAAYGVDTARIAKVLTFSKYQKTYLYSLTTTMELPKAEKGSAAFISAKNALLDAIDAAIAAAPAEPNENVTLYIKDGLVAVFDAYDNVAKSETIEKWDAVYLYEREGYTDYIDPSLYSVKLVDSVRYDWKNVDGGIRAVLTDSTVSAWNHYNYMDFSSLAALLGYTYTVQEVLTQQREENVIQNGVLTNYANVVGSQARVSANWIGPYNYGGTFLTGVETKTDGANKLVGVLVEQMQFGEISNTYIGHFSWIGTEFGSTLGSGITAPDGTDLTKYYIGASTVTVDRTFTRRGYVKTTMQKDGVTVDAWESTIDIYYPSAPWTRNSLSPQGSLSKTTDKEAEHTSKRMHLGGDHATVHSIRIYNRALSKAEIDYNHVIDVLAFAGVDYSLYLDLDEELKALVADLMSGFVLTRDGEVVTEALEKYADLALAGGMDYKETLYVTEGLTVLLSAYKGYSTASSAVATNAVLWTNAVDPESYATLKGTGWKAGKNGGHEIVRTIDDYAGTRPEDVLPGTYAFYTPKEEYGIYLDGEWLLDGEYTVELVANPVGITKDDGTRFIDTYSKYGTYIENGFAIGPLRALQFACYRVSWTDGQMWRRWNYGKGNTPYADNGSKPIVNDQHWQGLGLEEIVTLNISRTVSDAGDHTFAITQGNKAVSFTIGAKNIISNKTANNMFRLMCGVAGTVYSVRMYDHVLTSAEKAQNHMADLVYYYDLDLGVIGDLIKRSPETMQILVGIFEDIGFDMDPTEAQELFSKKLTTVWLSYNGFAVKNDLTDGLRYYYTINTDAINAAIGAGLSVEIGTVVNIGKGSAPVLDGYGYDYRVVAFDSTMGKEKGIFVDEDTYAVTVCYSGVDRELLGKTVNAVGYLKITYEDGSEIVYYTVTEAQTPQSLFESYYLIDKENIADASQNEALSSFISKRIAASYSDTYVYLDKGAAAGGNGSKEAPYNNFEDAFAKCKSILSGLNTPTNVTLEAADGRYAITETQALLDADKPYEYSYFTVKSTGGKTVLTTTVDIDASKFVLSDENIYSYQFEKDENGNYPAFRILHVNDAMATIATNGSDHADEREDLYTTAFDRTFNGIAQLAKDLSTIEDYGFDFIPESYEGREDLIEEFVYYRDQYIAYNEIYALVEPLLADIKAGVKITADYANPISYTLQPSAQGSAAYKSAFHKFKLEFMGAIDLLLRVHSRNLQITSAFFKDMTAESSGYTASTKTGGNAADYEVYANAFALARTTIYNAKNKNILYTSFEVISRGDDVRNIGKVYMPADMVGDLSALVEKGKLHMTERAEKDVEDLTASLAVKTDAYLLAKDKYEEIAAVTDKGATLDAARAALVSAEEAKVAVAGELKKAEALLANMQHETLWIRYALLDYKIEIHHTAQWNYNIIHVGGVDYADYVEVMGENGVERHVAVYQATTGFQINEGYSTGDRYVHMKNAYEYLDEAGEYYYDELSGTLYLYSETPVKDFDIEYATTDWMFTFFGVEKVNFENVQFTGTDDYWLTENDYKGGLSGMSPYVTLYGTTGFQDRAALYFNDCSEVRVTGCRFYELSCEAINAAGWNTDYYIAGNSFERIGSASVRFGTHKPVFTDPTGGSWFEGEVGARNITVADNYFNDISTEYYVPAIMITKLDGGSIKNNTIIDCTFTSISLGWDFDYKYDSFDYDNRVNLRNVDVSYNYIMGWMTEMGDGGAIYTCDPNQSTGYTDFYMNLIHHNYLVFSKNTGDGLGNMNCGIYFDICASNWYCYENVVAEQAYGATLDETDYDAYGITEEDAELLRLRRGNSHFMYLQHIDDQPVHNILMKDNFFLNVRAEEEDGQRYEIYKDYLTRRNGVKRNLVEEGSIYVVGLRGIPNYAQSIVQKSGSTGHKGDLSLLLSNRY